MSQFGAQTHAKSHTALSGSGKKKLANRSKRRHEAGGYFVATKFSDKDVMRETRGRGGNVASKLQFVTKANILTESGYKQAKIKAVLESRDNKNFARLAIITKGSVIDTELGKAQVINKVGKDGCVNAKLLK